MGETHVNEEKSLTELMGEASAVKEEQPHKDRLQGMRKKTDLSDIILEKENSTNARTKKIILGAASLVLLFLIFLIISKMLNTTTKENSIDKQNNTSKIVTTQNIEKSAQKAVEPIVNKKEDKTVNDDTDIKFEEMVRKLREEDAKENNTEVVKVVTPKKEVIKEQPKVKIIEEKPQIPTIEKPKKEPKIIITDVKKSAPTKKTIENKIKRPNPNLIFGQNSGYYIQVGATTSPNPNRFLVSKLNSNGYSYITHPIIVKGKKFYKVLIGPFSSKAQAQAKLPRVRATINPQAFLYHLR